VSDWEDALERIAQAQGMLDEVRDEKGSDAAQDFCDSVGEKLESMAAWIADNDHVTPKMEDAIANIIAGIEKWQ